MRGSCFLATYRPIVKAKMGRRAVEVYSLPPFIDGSCRREPDYESPFPSITATCRAGLFAPRLDVGDRIAYMTVKGKYTSDSEKGYRLVAVLQVIRRFASHEEAAHWYREQNLPLPSNCLVDGNPPKPFELTNGDPPAVIKKRLAAEGDYVRAIRLWDAIYRGRVARFPVFLVTKAEFLELYQPPQLSIGRLRAILGRIPGTLNPPSFSSEYFERLVQLAGAFTGGVKRKDGAS
jgi:hypothetical protein